MKTYFIFFMLLALNYTMPESFAQSPDPQYPSHVISNDEVRMHLYLPDPQKGSYRASRFDWSGIINSVKYKGHEYFGAWKDSHDPMVHEDLAGPAEGYWKPGLNYEEAKPGEGFIRIGVGILEKPDEEEYQSFHTYKFLDHGKWSVEKGKDRIVFTHELSSDFGYAYIYTKEIRLTENEPGFVISHSLKNTGSKLIETDQFNHNFFMIDGEPTGPNMEVSFPFDIKTESDLKGLLEIEGKSFEYQKVLERGESVFLELEGFGSTPGDHGFTMLNTRTGAGIRMHMDRPVERYTFWCITTTICPENALLITAAPGETFTWEATYSFFEK